MSLVNFLTWGLMCILFCTSSFAQKIINEGFLKNHENVIVKESINSIIIENEEYKKNREICIDLQRSGINSAHCAAISELLNDTGIYIAKGALSGAGNEDIVARAVFLMGSGNGSLREHLFVFFRRSDETLTLTDHIELKVTRGGVKNFRIEDGFVMMDSIQYKEGDAGCCPSAKKLVKYKVDNGKIMKVPSE